MKLQSKSIPIFLVLLFVGLVGMVWYFDSRVSTKMSATQRIHALSTILNRDAVLEVTPLSTEWITFKGQYIRFSYPKASKVYDTSQNPTILEAFSYQDLASRALVTVQVTNVPGAQNIGEYPSFHTRGDQQQEYKKRELTIGSTKFIEFRKQGVPNEISGFLEKDGNVISIVLTGASVKAMDTIFTRTISSLAFE